MQDGALFELLAAEMKITIAKAGNLSQLASHARELANQLQRMQDVTQTLHAVGDLHKTLMNASLYLEAFGHIVIAWIWLEQAIPCAVAIEDNDERRSDFAFYRGKLQACHYFYQWELPKIKPQLDLLVSIDPTTLNMQNAWF